MVESEFNILTATIEVEMYGKTQGEEIGCIDTYYAMEYADELIDKM